jgi:hypothetical protein
MIIKLKRPATCHECGARILAGTQAKWYRSGAVFGLFCHGAQAAQDDSRTRAAGDRGLQAMTDLDAQYEAQCAERTGY